MPVIAPSAGTPIQMSRRLARNLFSSEVREVRFFWYFVKSLCEDLWEAATNRMPFRGKLCRILGHRYRAIWLKSDDGDDAYGGFADTEAGCRFCGATSPNEVAISEQEIDFDRTGHRSEAPVHNVYRA